MLLLDDDYAYLGTCGLAHEEDEQLRCFVLKDFPLPQGMYSSGGHVLRTVNVLVRIPSNYPSAGTDMLWVSPSLTRTDGKSIPAAHVEGQGDASFFKGVEYCRWSRHYADGAWKPGVDGIEKIINRIEWALRNPDADKPKQ